MSVEQLLWKVDQPWSLHLFPVGSELSANEAGGVLLSVCFHIMARPSSDGQAEQIFSWDGNKNLEVQTKE